MDPPCILVSREILPYIKMEVSKGLDRSGMSQRDIAKRLGVSQAMVSKYLADRGRPKVLRDQEVFNLVSDLVSALTRMAQGATAEPDMVLATCQVCFRLREKGLLCPSHGISGCNACHSLRSNELAKGRKAVIDDLKAALKEIEGADIAMLQPEVRMNLAQATPDARSQMDVGAIPGRLTDLRGKIIATYEPEFGSSSHLSQVILAVMKGSKRTRAVMNIKMDPAVERAARSLKFKIKPFDRKTGSDIIKFAEGVGDADIIMDKGDFGIEPCAYVLGRDALDVIRKVKDIARRYE